KTLLIFPCQWSPTQPYLSTPYLTSYLRSKGWDVVQRDFNILSYDLFLSRSFLEKARTRIKKRIDLLHGKPSLTKEEGAVLEDLSTGNQYSEIIISQLGDAKKVMRSPDLFFNFDNYRQASMIIQSSLKLISDAYPPSMLSLFTYRSGDRAEESTRKAQKAVNNKDANPFIDLYEGFLLGSERWEDYTVIGISIIGMSQIIPGLTLARIIKERYPHLHIVLGGPILSVIADRLKGHPEFFKDFCHTIINLEGEEPLHQLLTALKSGSSFKDVPSLVYLDDGRICQNEQVVKVRFDEMPSPTFDGLPIDLYLSPYPVIPVLQSRGCYWGKCTFCTHSYIYGQRYSKQRSCTLVDELDGLSKKYNTRYFTFSDEAVSPSSLNDLSDQIIERRLDVRALALLRFEKKMDAPLFEKMRKAGFTFLLFGLESANNRILSLMQKGASKETARDILQKSRKAGIWNHLFLFFGFPTETREEAMETIEFLKENSENIHSFAPGVFILYRDSPIHHHPDRFSVTRVFEPPDTDISMYLGFEVSKGMPLHAAKEANDLCVKIGEEIFPSINIWGEMPREHFLLYLDRYGMEDLCKGSGS
ncbi:MAG TPA: radical SAM protein, partial [Nitrospiria bacterium]|nr:radical SAM protein [Nitrospiria bacterium]